MQAKSDGRRPKRMALASTAVRKTSDRLEMARNCLSAKPTTSAPAT